MGRLHEVSAVFLPNPVCSVNILAESDNLRHVSLVLFRPKGRQRKLWKDEGRWEHDKFREDEQAPKSRQELIALYGYDIRSAHNPDDIKPRRIRKPR